MGEKEFLNRYSILLQQLELVNRYKNHFEEILGRNGRIEKINKILDEMIPIRKMMLELK